MKSRIVAAIFLATFALPAQADLLCGGLLMPAGQLKQVSRGIAAHHAGLDLVAPHGSPLRAAAAGTVVAARTWFDYGKLVDIDHGNGVMTRYAHMAGFAPGIRPGVRVSAGQLLGQVGRTGRATTAHVHFEVRINDRPVDPKPYLSLAACTPATPQIRFATAGIAPPHAATAQQLAQAPERWIEGRPGGLLD